MSVSAETSSPAALAVAPQASPRKQERLKRGLRKLVRSKTGLIGAVLLLLIVGVALFAPWIAPHSPGKTNVSVKLLPPMWMSEGTAMYPLGTDNLGRDLLSRLVYGSRVSLIVGLCSVALSGLIGLVLGLLSGFYGGWIDHLIMRVVDAFLAIPTILFMLLIMSILGPGLGTLIFVIGITGWVSYARMVRSEVLSIRERDYVRSSRAVGARNLRILFVHILPNVFSSFIVISTLNVAGVIISEASLSFMGLGIQPPDVSWGGMLSEGRQYLATSWWVATFPGIAITITVLAIIFLGDWLRDTLDPKLK
ncbi:ABC transporter permease [Paenibacillus senegalimassiliensis]|uniref:ABC transporter permease n=1 Tax=Paenibacillus senegalimassiliensis TaxID=1737426 RepID=UPI00073E9904|nr:ABC transporter permease [Paenibacillus senegalimassiliensis]